MKIIKRSILSADEVENERELSFPEQEFDSAKTSINSKKLPAVYRMIQLQPGTVGVDFGGGRWDSAVEYLRDQDVTLCVYDPYNRSAEHNRKVLRTLRANGGADFAVNSNVLNVIKEPEARKGVLENIKKITKSGAPIYITVYEGRGDAKEGVTKSGYQLNRKTADYLEEIQEVFPDAKRRGKLIVATNKGSANSSVDIKASSEIIWDDLDWNQQIQVMKRYIRNYKGTRIFEDFADYINKPVEDIIDSFCDAESRGDIKIPERKQLDSEYRNDDIYSTSRIPRSVEGSANINDTNNNGWVKRWDFLDNYYKGNLVISKISSPVDAWHIEKVAPNGHTIKHLGNYRSLESAMEAADKHLCKNCGAHDLLADHHADDENVVEASHDEICKAISGDKYAIQSLKKQGYKINRLTNPLQISEVGTYEIIDPTTGKKYNYDNTLSYYANTKVTASQSFLDRIEELMEQGLDEETASREAYAEFYPDEYDSDDYDSDGYDSDEYDEDYPDEYDGIYSSTTSSSRYWYFTRHGVQPGSVPKYVNILDIVDKPEGSYFLADGVILTKDLRDYDIKERKPEDSVTSSTRIEYSDILEEIREQCNTKLIHIMAQYGFDESEAKQYSRVDASIDDNQYGRIEIGCELDYDGLMRVCQELDPIVQAYDPDSYFEPVDSGIAEAYVNLEKASIDSSSNIQAGAYDFPEPSLDPPEYPEPEEGEETVEVECDINQLEITVEEDGSWEYQRDDFLDEMLTAENEITSEEYDVYIRDRNGLIEDFDSIVEPNIPGVPGTYLISCHVKMVYDVTGVEIVREYQGKDEDGDPIVDEDYYTGNADVEFNRNESYITNFYSEEI